MKDALAGIALALLLVCGAAAQTKPNFSGTWILDVAKTDFGPAPKLEAMSHEITHKEPTIRLATRQKTAQGELVNDRTITTDGKENSNHIKTMVGDQDVKSTSTWDGAKLATTIHLDVQGTPVEIVDVWELSADGRVLTISRKTTAGGEVAAQKFVFNKQ